MQNKLPIKLLDFLKTGQLGPLHLGITIKETVSAFGAPSEQYQLVTGFLLAYGGWEIQYRQEKPHQAYLIQHGELIYDCTNHDEVIQLVSDNYELDLGVIRPFTQVRLKDIKGWLDKEKVAYHIKLKAGQPLMKLNSGAYLDFLDTEPVVPTPGQTTPETKTKIENVDDYILYTIGIFSQN